MVWRAQMQARQESGAARPITVVQGVAGLAGIALVIACFVAASPWLESSLTSFREFLTVDVADIRTFAGGWVLAAGVALLAITSLAVYLVVAED